MSNPKRTLHSSLLSAAHYDPRSQTMELSFQNGKTYRYQKVPEHVYNGLIEATGSHGKHFHAHINGKYEHELV